MISNGKLVNACDVPIVKLVPHNERQVPKKYLQRIEASLRAVGLLDPLVVFRQGDNYEILDGGLRYRILLEMGVETVPCLVGNQREAVTGNRMVNQVSPAQEMRMLRKSLEELDETTIANALGMVGISHRWPRWQPAGASLHRPRYHRHRRSTGDGRQSNRSHRPAPGI